MITIVLPISRKDYLLPMFRVLDGTIRPADTELLIVTDCDNECSSMIQTLLDTIHFPRVQVVNFGDSPASEIKDRRKRIPEIHNFAKQFINEQSDQVFLMEDDTVFQAEALMQLIEVKHMTGAAFVSGVEMGRWKTPYIGGWIADDIKDPQHIYSVKPGEGLQEIDGPGLYCGLVDYQLYMDHEFAPFYKKGINGLGCDINFGLWIRNKGLKVILNWEVLCGHYKEGKQLLVGDVRPVVIDFEKDPNGKWLGTNHWADEEVS